MQIILRCGGKVTGVFRGSDLSDARRQGESGNMPPGKGSWQPERLRYEDMLRTADKAPPKPAYFRCDAESGARAVLASQQMAFVDLTKQLAKEAFLSATKDPPAPAAPAAPADNVGAIIFGQIHGLQKALKDDEELVVWFANAGEKLRVMRSE